MNLAATARRIWRYCAYPAFGLVVFLVGLYVTFPYERLRDRLVQTLQEGRDLDVSIGDVKPGWAGGLVLENVSVRPTPTGSDEPGAPLNVAEARVRFGLLAALFGSLEAGFSADLMQGELEGEVDADDEATRLRLSTDGLALAELAWIPSAIGLPLLGTLRADVDLTLPEGNLAKAEGTIDLDCGGCALGDGKSKFKLAGSTGFLAAGLTLPKLGIGDWKGRITVEKGKAVFDGFETKSPDGETALEGEIGLRDPIAMSQMRVYFRFKLADQLKRKDPKLELLEQGLSASGRRDDGFYGVRISGRLGDMRFLPSRYSPVAPKKAARAKTRSKPRRVTRPWTPPKPKTPAPPVPEPPETPAPSTEKAEAPEPKPSPPTPSAPAPPPPSPPEEEDDEEEDEEAASPDKEAAEADGGAGESPAEE